MPIAPDSDPFDLFNLWFDEAKENEPNDPNAMALATATKDAVPSVRIVLLKEHDREGFVFYTNLESQKGQELHENPAASICFHWKSLLKQVRINGKIQQVSDEQAQRYYNTRPRGSRLSAWASTQSKPLDARETFEKRIEEFDQKFEEQDFFDKPPFWSGFRLIPSQFEFWEQMNFRRHDRFTFTRNKKDDWKSQRLYP